MSGQNVLTGLLDELDVSTSQRTYIMEVLEPNVLPMVSACLQEMPADPVPFLIQFLKSMNESSAVASKRSCDADPPSMARITSTRPLGRSQTAAASAFNKLRFDSDSLSCSPTPQRIRILAKAEHVGSYGLVVHFLKTCKSDDMISPDEYHELLRAVEDIGRRSDDRVMTVAQAQNLTGGADAAGAFFLPSLGFARIDEPKEKEPKDSKDQESLQKKRRSTADWKDSDHSGTGAVLHDRSMNCRTRTDISADVTVIIHGFRDPFDFMDRYKGRQQNLESWIRAISSQYNQSASYHNWFHAFDVFQLCYMALIDGGVADYFNYQDTFAILIAAIAHDVGHPGTNNVYQIKNQTLLAVTYNDRSPLENMHASITFQTLNKPGNNFLDGLPPRSYDTLRSKIIDAILATDPSHHFEYVDKLSTRCAKTEDNPFTLDTKDDREKQLATKEDRRLLLAGFVHMADIGNGLRPWEVYKDLVVALEDEFFVQGDKERDMGIPITPMMDRTKDSLAAGQGFFLGKLVLPLYELYSGFIEPEFYDVFKSNLLDNKERWEKLVEKHGKKTSCEILRLLDET